LTSLQTSAGLLRRNVCFAASVVLIHPRCLAQSCAGVESAVAYCTANSHRHGMRPCKSFVDSRLVVSTDAHAPCSICADRIMRQDYADKSWQTDTSLAAPTGTFQSRQVMRAASSVVRWRSLALMLAQGVCAQGEISSPFLLRDKTVQPSAWLPSPHPDDEYAPVFHGPIQKHDLGGEGRATRVSRVCSQEPRGPLKHDTCRKMESLVVVLKRTRRGPKDPSSSLS